MPLLLPDWKWEGFLAEEVIQSTCPFFTTLQGFLRIG
jgi:hypothetical protein